MSRAIFDNYEGPGARPANFPYGFTVGSGLAANINHIGTAGQLGFGVGICPGPLPTTMGKMFGTEDPNSDNYGNYQCSVDGSVMCWIPAFYYKIGTGANGLAVNVVSIAAFSAYADVAAAAAAGYALHRAFYDGGVQPGVFVDKYQCSNNGGIASSLKNGLPLSSAAAHNPFAGLTGTPANFLYGAIASAKTRGASFFCNTRFIHAALALLSLAHGQASSTTTWCAWYHATNNFPKGCNNNALGDAQDAAILYVSDGYSNCGKTGSANLFARTAHNGQNSGVVDLNGNMWEITLGLTTNDAGDTYYALKTTTRMKDVTGGTGGATDLWGAAGLAALYDSMGATFGAAVKSDSAKTYGNAAQVLSEATSGAAWTATGLGVPLVGGVGGTNLFGNDGFWDYRPAAMCPISSGSWTSSSNAGVWASVLSYVRGNSDPNVGFRAALFL